uniref:Ribosomal_L7Ae domain-containing protein n=1 Tax=Macrostomum lignano TaxID=282301 RepID=A0A1I8G0D2_9PLAT
MAAARIDAQHDNNGNVADLESLISRYGSSSMVSDDVTAPNLVNASMQECLAMANTQGRLVAGFKAVVDALEKNSHQCLFCVLPENLWNDDNRKAMFCFVISLCHQHNVKMIKVDDDQLVRKIIDRTSGNPNLGTLSYECILIQSNANRQKLPCDQHMLLYIDRFPDNDFENLPLVKLSEF